MNAIPCIASRDADRHANDLDRIEAREAAVEDRTEMLKRDMWQDLEYLSDAFEHAATTIGYYRNRHRAGMSNHPQAVMLLRLLRDRTNDTEMGDLIEQAMRAYLDSAAEDRAEEEIAS